MRAVTSMSERLPTHEDWRRDLPLLAAPDVQADAVDGMRKRLAELLDDPTSLTRYRAEMDGQAVGRTVPSLAYFDTVPVDGGLLVRRCRARWSTAGWWTWPRSPIRTASPWKMSSGWSRSSLPGRPRR
jgi:hypothetical protein